MAEQEVQCSVTLSAGERGYLSTSAFRQLLHEPRLCAIRLSTASLADKYSRLRASRNSWSSVALLSAMKPWKAATICGRGRPSATSELAESGRDLSR